MLIEKPVVVKPFGSHCHERVFMAMKALGCASKNAIAEACGSTPAVVANAMHDFRKGMYTEDGNKWQSPKERVGKEWHYELECDNQLTLDL